MNEEQFCRLCFSNDLRTSDPYDVWKTQIGLLVKNLWNKSKFLGTIPAALITIFDQYINNRLRLFYTKQEFPIVRALAASCLLNKYEKNNNPIYLFWAKAHIDWLVNNYSKGYSGYCWGLNMDWASKNGLYGKDTPFITHTPYVLEALIRYQKLSNEDDYQEIIKSIYKFINIDLLKIINNEEILCLSYAPLEEPRIVINANSYALYSLSLLFSFLPEKLIIKNDIICLFNFIASVQNKDGSWWYYHDKKAGNFIDCFHTCFILKNLIKSSRYNVLPANHTTVIERGYHYLMNNFYDEKKGLFKRYAKSDKLGLVKFDLYDNAEMLNLANLYGDTVLFNELKHNIEKEFFKKNEIYSTIDLFNLKKNKNMLRWAIMPYLNAISSSNS